MKNHKGRLVIDLEKKTFEIIPKTHDLQMLHVAYLSIECFLSGFDSKIMNFRA